VNGTAFQSPPSVASVGRLDDGRRFRRLEEIDVVCPLGLRFWDPVLDRPIRDGLVVRAWPATTAAPVVGAFRSRSGVYAFQGLPGMRPVERPSPLDAPASPPTPRRFVVEVRDARGRFLPAAFEVELPLPYRGVFLGRAPGSPASPPGAVPGFVLFPAPARERSPGIAAVRGELADANGGAPAAHAKVRVELPGGIGHWSLADRTGRFAVHFPLPPLKETLPPLGGSPPPPRPSPPVAPVEDRTWEIVVSVSWEPAALTPLRGTDQPDHRNVLAQTAAGVLASPPGAPSPTVEPSWSGVLGYDGEVVVKTAGSSRLWIVPGGSPP
jgi:hypothetical protein